MEGKFIDINCDVGEGMGNEAELLPLISSCNIACGGHAGDDETMAQVIQLAKKYDIKPGAHPSYPDTKNFGRSTMEIEPEAFVESIRAQINRLENILDHEGVSLHHIKPHGALYNDLAKNEVLADLFLEVVTPYKKGTILYVPPNSVIAEKAVHHGFHVKYEAFADRSYNEDLSLVSRKLPNAVLNEPQQVLDHLVKMVIENKVMTINGRETNINAQTYCVHGDTPGALRILMYLSKELPKKHIYIKK